MPTALGQIDRSSLTRGVREAQAKLRLEYISMNRHHAGVAKASEWRHDRGLKLNLGCGPNVKLGWLNVDLFHPCADISLDLREDWPFTNESVDIVYSEHSFEHLEHPKETTHFLHEAFRVLRGRGILSIGVPDSEWPILAYRDPTDPYWQLAKEKWHPADCRTRIDHLNYHFRQNGQHKFAWDYETLGATIAIAQFVDVRRREFDPEQDCRERAVGTIYAEARKPG